MLLSEGDNIKEGRSTQAMCRNSTEENKRRYKSTHK